ncbi:16S rRNA (cytosine(967)-C(5))-methyltransferase RsmB [Thermosediminibacter oceani]|uniref:16S rRNA (cytosine(967)-C(5))-methyltransferase n=1 Tax=Thermosediminibacter oceani (strain ATCC BAA-1034 / DSM 16646 / JW/IW-1228P) TaxID=555079 RepID=D9S314_THEOJ|nr:16S rRNA (cytosine(967)-C(5))-methyltransferase RsmB [Thermosediminibacter oceani]ADL07791.1 sun protein [Thermosediminibacter oceani DSM 16646]
MKSVKLKPRELAVRILTEVERGSYSNLSLNRHLTAEISREDRALITELVYGVIKHRIRLDYVLSKFSKIGLNDINPIILNCLRVGLYQILFLDKIPDYAAVNESVNIAKLYSKKAAGFVNGVLRNVIRSKDGIDYPDRVKDPLRYLVVYYSFPKWMIRRWLDLFGFEFTESLCKAFNEKPRMCVRVNELKINKTGLQAFLDKEGVVHNPGLFLEEALYIDDGPPLTELDSFKNGYFQPQDESSMLVARALGAASGETVLDVAAAPGGKTTHLAQLMKNSGRIYAWDIHPHRVQLLKETCQRLGVSIVYPEVRDARVPDKNLFGKFDRVLVDAPCSGLGVIRRKPDIKWTKKPEDIPVLKREQLQIIRVSSQYVKPGGILIYSTCSIEPEENREVVKEFLKENRDFDLDDIRPHLPEALSADVKEQYGYIQIYPNLHSIDGFFIARLKRIR